ncbi:MAG: protein translocase subunit SecDF [Bacteroidales bacterium]
MRNKGIITAIAIFVAVVCIYQLTFTFVGRKWDRIADEYASAQSELETDLSKKSTTFNKARNHFLDSMNNTEVLDLGVTSFTLNEVRQNELNMGLDLKGGMNVVLEVSVADLIRAYAANPTDPAFSKALNTALEDINHSQDRLFNLFTKAYYEQNPGVSLVPVFASYDMKDKVTSAMSNEEVEQVIKAEIDDAIDNSFNVLRDRIDKFGVVQPNIQKMQTPGQIMVELPGVTEPERVRGLLQGAAILEFWPTYKVSEVANLLVQANAAVKNRKDLDEADKVDTTALTEVATNEEAELASADTTASDSTEASALDSLLDNQDLDSMTFERFEKESPLFAKLTLNQQATDGNSPMIGFAFKKDTATVNEYLAYPEVRNLFSGLRGGVRFAWGVNKNTEQETYILYALRVETRDGKAPLSGNVITDARSTVDQMKGMPEVTMQMNSEGTATWARMTRENVGNFIAIVLDGDVKSAPSINGEIPYGRSSITGDFTITETQDLANILKSGKMPASAKVVQEQVVGPSLGQEAIHSGMISFIIAFILILLYMLFFYGGNAGGIADIALIVNMLFIFGILASLRAVLTLPGIAGIVLTIGMAVDANVLIFERIQEELLGGKGVKLAIKDGYKNALSAILDGNITTFLTGVVLYFFGSGPIKGFATTLMVGIITSLFCAIFISRLLFEVQLKKNRENINFSTSFSKGWLRNTNINFIGKRKVAYFISGALITISLISLVTRGLDYGIDFKGGRTFVFQFDQDVNVENIKSSLATRFGSAPDVKTYGDSKGVIITTDYKIGSAKSAEENEQIDNEVEDILYTELKGFVKDDVTKQVFLADYRTSSEKVGPTVSKDIRNGAIISISIALLLIFLYIVVRFLNWQYGLGAIASLAHDSIIVLGIFSLLHGWLPFSLDIDQSFIAAILTVLGYSINDTVVVFDRIRENFKLHPKMGNSKLINMSVNSTLRRTFSTSLSTLVVLLAICIFGGTSVRGFVFALIVGIVVGTYSSIFVATPVAYDTMSKSKKN